MGDLRKRYIISISGNHFNADTTDNGIEGESKLEQFLDNENCLTLCATFSPTLNKIQYFNEISSYSNRTIIFYKTRPSRIFENNVYDIVQLIVLQGSPSAALYHTLHNVFTPLLVQEGKKSNAVNINLQRQLINFQSSLRSAAFVADNGDSGNVSEQNSLSVISTLDHEVEYWNILSNSAKSNERAGAAAFRDILKPLARDFSMLDALQLIEVEDALEGAHNVLDDLWRHEPPYPRHRMQHLMDVIASDVIHCITRQLSDIDVWTKDYASISDILEQSISVGKKWSSTCTHLTQLFWPNYSIHPWTGESYTPPSLSDLVKRLEEVLSLRALHRQLVQLLNQNELETLRTSDMFKPFNDLNILQCGPYSEASWRTAVKQFEYLLQPAEQRVAEKLKIQLASVSSNTRQLLYEFRRYTELMDRPVVRKILLAERQNLLVSLGQYIKQLSGMMTAEKKFSRLDTPPIIMEINHIRMLESKALIVQQTVEKLLNDLSSYDDLQVMVTDLLKDLKHQHSELFDSWTRELTLQINNKSLSLKETDPVVQFSSAQLMRVNYSPRLVTLVREYRQLAAMGYRIPTHIEQTATHAKQFMKYAKALEQVANFHNTIGDRMIESERPMMLASALELSKLVQQQEVVSWGDVRSVEKYVDTLRSAVNRLSRENNLLASYHMQMKEKIVELADVDLLKHLQKWKDTAKEMREIVSGVEKQGFTNMQSWRLDVDRTFAAQFEQQYRNSLKRVHLHLPEIYVDLIYRDSKLQFNPPQEKLNEKYQHQLKRFLELPKSFRGVTDITEGSVFSEIIGKCQDLFLEVEKQTKELFERLQGVIDHWQAWTSLGNLDTSKLITWEHWDLNFRASKTFGQEVAKLPSKEERVGCFIVCLSSLRSDLESHNRSYWSLLVISLQDSIAQDVVKLQQYVNTSTALLTKQPLTMEQIGEAHASHNDIIKQLPEMQKLLDETLNKNKTLANWTRERVDSVARLQAAWERLEALIDNHQHLISKQVEGFKTTINRNSENLNGEIERFALHWDQFKPRPGSGQIANDSLKNLEQYLITLKEKKIQWNNLLKQKENIQSDCDKFGITLADFPLCEQIQVDIEKEEKVWLLFEEFKTDLEKLTKEEWIVFRKKSYRLEEFVTNWQKRLESVDATALTTRLLQELQKYETVVPVLKYVRGEDFTEKHWVEIFSLLGIAPKPIDILTLEDFLTESEKLSDNAKELQAICKRAASEVVVRQALAELDQWEVQTRFVLSSHIDSQHNTIMLIKDFKEILNKIGDNQCLLQSVKNSADYESFSDRAGLWETKLADLDYYLTSLSQIQRKWVYLEPIFGSGTLRQERSRFDRLDRDFRHILSAVERDTRVTSLARYPNIRTLLDTLQDQLNRCQNSLDDFLKEKRSKFPRFLFLGDEDLLEILGQSSREQVLQAHLKKLFAGINSIKMDANGQSIEAICSLQGEVVPLIKAVNINRPVEEWLNELVTQMQDTLRKLLIKCLTESQQSENGPDPLQYPSQILCLADSIVFTSRCEASIQNATLPPLLATYKNQLKKYSTFKLSFQTQSTSATASNEDNSDKVLDLKLKALMLDTIHHIGVLEELINYSVTSLNNWHWQKQLRFYSSNDGSVKIRMVNAEMNYSYEYMGNENKLVRTPLTDKCFLTLTQGMHLGMGGNPYGPAGTGKTESVKALGALLGRQVLVFNCDEGVDATSMGHILSGLVQSGAWGCFDEFNRLDEATLSAISMFIQPIQVALRSNKPTVSLLQKEINVNPNCGIFVTLNPAGGGYLGRNRLPDNLKQLFRPVVMSHPDHEQIAKTLLKCDGFQNADKIGRKLVEVFTLANELLSKQLHYDWGLRALKTLVNSCGSALNEARKLSNISDENNLKQEIEIVVQALRVNTLSKLTFSDSSCFDSLVRDVFMGIPFRSTGSESLINALEESCAELGIEVNSRQISKCIELYEQLQQRMGVTIVGPSGSGKTTLRKLLFHALNKMKKTISQHVFNPKAMTKTQLLGHIDLDTRQWSDGVLTVCAHQVYSEPPDVCSWIVCDGDVDPEWIESLNSVLDDNRLLTLPSGWRIQFGPNVNFIFETHDLSYASPATISRMGIVFMSEEDLNLNDVVSKWLESQPKDNMQILSYLINEYFFKAIDWMKSEGDLTLQCSSIAVVQTGLSQLTKVTSKSHFTTALIAGLGGLLSKASAEIFAQKVFEWTGEHCPDENNILQCFYNKDRDLIDIHYSDNNNKMLDSNLNEQNLIMTGLVRSTLERLQTWLTENSEHHFLLVGPHGSAKSLILNHIVQQEHSMDIATIYCSANITPQYVLHKLSEHCMIVNSNKGKIYRPKRGRLVLYFKGLQLVKPDQWNTSIVVSFLHQLITYGGLYDSNLEWVGVENITIVGSMTATKNLCSRFISLMKIYTINLPSQEDLNIIFESYLTSILKSILSNATWIVKSKIVNLVSTILSIYEEVQNTFTILQNQHYVFSPHVLTKWCFSLLRYKILSEVTDIENTLLEIICYEARRLFSDRLVNEEDKTKFESILSKHLQMKWGKSVVLNNLTNIYYVPTDMFDGRNDLLSLNRISSEDWINMVKKGISFYARDGHTLNLVIIPELLTLTSLLARALTHPGGSALMAGRSGIGRRSALRIVSSLQNAKLVTPSTASITQFKIDLKMAIQSAGIEGEHVYILVEDHMIANNDILNMLNTLLLAGEVPGLYNYSEFESLLAGLKDEADREDFVGNLTEFFNKRIRNKLHLIFCMEIDNLDFGQTLENCPALYQTCSVIWQSEWSLETMMDIPNLLLRKLSENETEERFNLELPKEFHEIHSSIKSALSTPRRYMSFINNYFNIYSEKIKVIFDKQSKLKAGISKLTDAKQVVADLKVQALEQQEILADKQSKANSALDMISATMRNANVHKQEMEVLKQNTEKENEQLMKRKKEIELELAEVEPILQEARSAVGNIKTEALSEIRSLRAPPDIIRDILEGVLRLMGTQDTSWNSMKTFLSKRGVKEDIRSFDAARINSDNRRAVEKLLSTRSESFDPKNAKRASVAAAPLASWVIANVRYSTVVEKIRPLEMEQYKLQENLKLAEKQISELSTGLTNVDAKVAELKIQLSTYTKEAAEIEINLKAAQEKLNSAEGLVNKLNDEYERWGKQLKELSQDLETLPMKCLITAAFMTYLSEEFEDERNYFLEKWGTKLLGESHNFKFEEFLSSEREQLQWNSEGLLADQLSIQNASIILKSKNHVLLLDPSSVALNWLQTHLKHRSVEVVTPNAPRFNTSLELALRFGKIFIIKEIESVPNILLPILRSEFILQGERKLVLLGNKMVDYHNDFQLYLSSRNSLIKIPPDTYAVLSIVNFTTTKTGLTEQLLSAAIHQEYPELQTQKSDLLQKQENLQEQQFNLQNRLLEELANATGDILQNNQLLTSLNETKASSIAIKAALENLATVQNKLQSEYDVFRPLSVFGSDLYFAIKDMIKLNTMYTISITAFIKIFIKTLSSVEEAQNNLIKTQKLLLQSVYYYISRGMLKSDRLIFLLHLCHHMYPQEISKSEWKLFLGHTKINDKVERDSSFDLPQWIAPHLAQNVKKFQHTLPEVYNSLKLDEFNHWENFSKSGECEKYIPKFTNLTSFQQLVVVQMLRPDRLHTMMCQTVLHITGIKSLSPGNQYLSQIFKETVNTEPVLIINGPGADPSSELRELASTVVGSTKYTEISMGEGQEQSALKALEEASQTGNWICLKNLHLMTSWLPELSQKIQSLSPQQDFRLWLVTEPHDKFSSVLTQTCLKISYEAPQGIKNNLLRTYTTWDINHIQKQSGTGARLLFVLAYVHALLQERRTYIPQGWSKWYEFSDTDLFTAAKLAEEILMLKSGTLLWDYMVGLCGHAIYGGRIDQKQDDNILFAYFKQYFNDVVLSHKWKPTGVNNLPNTANFQEYVNSIKQMSETDSPSLFGLPLNIDRAWEKNVSSKLISTLTAIYLSKEKNEKFSDKMLFQNLTPLLLFWKKLNKGQEWVHSSISKNTDEKSPLLRFIHGEKQFSLDLIQAIHKYLSAISRIIRGTALPSTKDVDIARSLSSYQTPKEWISIWNGPTEPFKYLQAVVNKTAAVSKWDSNVNVDEFIETPINLSLLFHPNTFLAALKQHISRVTSVPLDELKLTNKWSGPKTKHSIILSNLLIEGATFDGTNLSASSPDMDSITTVPNCILTWVQQNSINDDDNLLKVPLYNSSTREKHITSIYLPSRKPEHNEWLLNGVALFLDY